MWRNTTLGWGLGSILIHWLSALAVIGLFALGWWMTGLTYYDAWYNLGPWWHRSVGMLLLGVSLLRVLWRLFQPTPRAQGAPLEKLAAHVGHLLIYLLLFVVLISGYLISTAEGRGISVFGWFSVPALVSELPNQATLAGEVHWYSAWALVILSLGHALAAFKHLMIDRNEVMRRMLDPRLSRRSR
ncbi:Cytochrome b561 [Modicisalibacter ilicicola DSM 19980]|uniref:Cytochrome b561 n=1 Tax=Modicisalibacter ilicicola DSM 19980 TaxID=1121942 RepID=A0A1M5BL51_9GAMM|nr:cytochrome b [Halomonas ilicicola]SHF43313.1 Cytochrome b561 [Halomonas ilicicola DSM 19980]